MFLNFVDGSPDAYKKAESYLDDARKQYKLYIQDGFLTDELISAALCLAYLEGVRRGGSFNEANLMTLDERDVADLRGLMSLVQEQDFKSQKACYLNPIFGSALSSFQGSNADLIIDDKLIDIKTTKHLVLDRQHLHQLVHYYILLSLGGINVGCKRSINYFEEVCEVNHICIYFSRHGYLHTMKITDLVDSKNLSGFMKWYIEAICPSEDERLAYCRKSYGLIAKKMVKEMQAAHRLKEKKTSKKEL